MTHEADWLEAQYGPVVVTVLGEESYELRYRPARGWWCSCDAYQYRGTCPHAVQMPETPRAGTR